MVHKLGAPLSFSCFSRLTCTLLFVLALSGGLSAQTVPALDGGGGGVAVLAAGNDRIVWLCERRVEDGSSVLRLAYCRAADSEDLGFRPLRIPALSGKVAAAAVRDENLHVFFSDGTHMRFVPPGDPRPLVAHSVRGMEVGLPGRAVPRTIFADASTQTLYALVTGEVAVRLPDRRADVGDDSDDEEQALGAEALVGKSEDSEPQSDRVDVTIEAPFAFVRYVGGDWVRDRWAPGTLDDGADVVAVWVRDGAIDLLSRRTGDAEFAYHASASRETDWSTPSQVGIPPKSRAVGAGWTSGGPVLVVRSAGGGNAGVVGYRKDDGRWTALPPFVSSRESGAALERASSLVLMGPRVVVVGASAGVVEAGSWSVTTGEELDEVGPVIAFAPTATPMLDPRIRNYAAFIVFAAVLVFVFITRRDGGLFRVTVGPTERVADLQARLFAFLLDLLITSPVWGGILYVFMYDDLAALSMFEQLRNPTPALEMILPVVSVVEALYGLVFEIAIRATPGKRLMGLKVVAEGGGRAKGGAIVARNLMRILEFQFGAVAILVFLTPSRQRLGDVLSRTLVVQRVAIPPKADEPSEDGAEVKK